MFKENAVVKGNMRVETNARVLNNVRVDQNIRVDGTSNLNGNVKMPNIGGLGNGAINSQNFEILVKTQNGGVKKLSLIDLVSSFYGKEDCNNPYNTIENPIWSNGTNKIYTNECNLVNVGIGTNNPAYKLDVKGVTFSQRLLVGKAGALTTALINGFDITNSRDLIQLGVQNAQTGNQPEVRFKITHDGTVFVKELRVRQVQNFPDYVFKTNYKLMSLYDLEKYIKQYNHLPNMPTAEEVERDGASVGEIQRVLVEKVEELTLYNIELKKQNDNLQQQINELKNEVAEIKTMLTK